MSLAGSIILQGLMLVLTSFLTYLITNSKKQRKAQERKQVAEADKEEFLNTTAVTTFWKESCSDLIQKAEILMTENDDLRKRVEDLLKELQDLKKKFSLAELK